MYIITEKYVVIIYETFLNTYEMFPINVILFKILENNVMILEK